MIGVPSETRQEIDMTMNLIKEVNPDHFHCSICTPMPKTYLYSTLMKEGFIKKDYWFDFAKNPNPSFKTPFASQIFTAEELRGIQNAMQKKFYFNPRIVLREIFKTRSFKQFFLKARLAFKMLFH
jgi:anaerobic magnesium-protoporphyrin IX monomethyl ester cyclase